MIYTFTLGELVFGIVIVGLAGLTVGGWIAWKLCRRITLFEVGYPDWDQTL